MRFARLATIFIALPAACSGVSGATNDALPAINAASPAMLPERTLACDLGRITNFDPSRPQSPDEYRFEGSHSITLFLPAIPVRTAPPPDPINPPEPVNPATRILSDADQIVSEAPDHFDRVVDYWPDRVELSVATGPQQSRFFVVSDINEGARTANLFTTQANDAVTWDMKHLYAGTCKF